MSEELEDQNGSTFGEADDGFDEEGGDEANVSDRLKAMEEKITGRKSQAEENLERVMQDPQIKAILEARQQGKEVKILAAEEEASPDKGEPLDLNKLDFDAMGNREVVDTVLQVMGQQKAAHDKSLKEALAEQFEQLKGTFSNVTNYVQDAQTQAANAAIAKCQEQHQDFEEFRGDMQELAKGAPQLSIDELYNIAKGRKLGNAPKQKNVGSERPTSSSARPSGRHKDFKKTLPVGAPGFAQMLAKVQGEMPDPLE